MWEVRGFELCQFCGNRGSVGRVSVFGCGAVGGVSWGLGQGQEGWGMLCLCES